MATVDRVLRRLDVKVVWWGPARSGKTTSLRSLHASFPQADRGALTSVETEDERTYFFDYAPLDLPRFLDYAMRVNAYTVPGQEAYVETRRRILRGADAVVFVADATPSAHGPNRSAFRQLDDALRSLEAGGPRLPVVVAVNKQDVPGALRAEEMARRLVTAAPTRPFVDIVQTVAIAGRGVQRCFRSAVVAAADHALSALSIDAGSSTRREYISRLDARFSMSPDAAPVARTTDTRAIQVPMSSHDPDAGGLETALASTKRTADLEAAAAAGGGAAQAVLARAVVEVAHMGLVGAQGPMLAQVLAEGLRRVLAVDDVWIAMPEGPDGSDVVFAGTLDVETDAAVTLAAEKLRDARPDRAAAAGAPSGRGTGWIAPLGPGERQGWLWAGGTTPAGADALGAQGFAALAACVGLAFRRGLRADAAATTAAPLR